MDEYIGREAVLQQLSCNHEIRFFRVADADGTWVSARDVVRAINKVPAADVVERKRGRCKFCGGKDNAFHIINAETAAYSGIELAINRQGMLRVRVYDDYECETALPRSSEIVMIAACPKCGADMREVDP